MKGRSSGATLTVWLNYNMRLLHFAFIGAFPGRYPQEKSKIVPYIRVYATPMNGDTLNLNVGGVKYSLFGDDIRKQKASFLEDLLRKSPDTDPVSLHRDGILFKYVNAFLVTGQLPRDATGRVDLDEDVLLSLKREAAFFGLKDLQVECDRIACDETLPLLERSSPPMLRTAPHDQLLLAESDTLLTNTLCQVWYTFPLAVRGSISKRALRKRRLLKKMTVKHVDVEQLTLLAKIIPQADKALEIKACLLSRSVLELMERIVDVSTLYPDVENVEVRARKLVIRSAGDVQDPTIDRTDEKDCLGFVEVLLNSTYTGGELQVDCGAPGH